MTRLADHAYILLTILFTVYSQLIIRWQTLLIGDNPSGFQEKCLFIMHLLINPWISSALAATFLAGISWMLAMSKFEISYAFPFVSITYILMVLAGFLLFNESLSAIKLVGTCLVVAGLVLIVRG